jgi:serine/threonine protein kinase
LEIGGDELSRFDLSETISEIKSFSAKRKIKGTFQAVLFGVSLALRTEKLLDFLQLTDKVEVDAKSTAVDGAVLEGDKTHGPNTGFRQKKRFEELYDLGARIHGGSFAVVNECFHREWREKYAVKIIRRNGRSDEAVLHEVAIMNHLDHPHIVKVVDFYEDEEYYYIIMELMTGGDVFDRIVSMKHYSEADARDLLKILLESVSYMHESGVAHRDLKPQNLLLKVRSCG